MLDICYSTPTHVLLLTAYEDGSGEFNIANLIGGAIVLPRSSRSLAMSNDKALVCILLSSFSHVSRDLSH